MNSDHGFLSRVDEHTAPITTDVQRASEHELIFAKTPHHMQGYQIIRMQTDYDFTWTKDAGIPDYDFTWTKDAGIPDCDFTWTKDADVDKE